ncbi:hypothetical protein AB1Y20_023722 [Prymnesium parvum]|uniref:Cytochrome b561 domain-containing protein n=1 Tax=Prymnesium parvum TaxID=97485 RepID=A0AB34JHH8_PRYPA
MLSRLRALSLPFGNATAFWCAGAGLTLFWFGLKAPAKLREHEHALSPAFRAHLLCSGVTSCVCMWNLCFSPSQGPLLAAIHKRLGRLGVATSLLGLSAGYVAAWTDEGVPRPTAAGLSAVGALQLYFTLAGVRHVRLAQHALGDERKRHLEKHAQAMNALFFGACLGPAWFRLPGWAAEAMGQDPKALPEGVMFLGMIPAVLMPRAAYLALSRRRFFG